MGQPQPASQGQLFNGHERQFNGEVTDIILK